MPSLGVIKFQTQICDKAVSHHATFGNDKMSKVGWKFMHILKQPKFDRFHVETRKEKFIISATATLEPKTLNENKYMQYQISEPRISSSQTFVHIEYAAENSDEIDEKESLRRMRISKANKGNTPWNRGRKHCAETIQRIRERTKLAMQNPKVKMKLKNFGHAQSGETRTKIGDGVRLGWQRRRQRSALQKYCLYEWENLIAEGSRRGFAYQEELQWDSYDILDKQLQHEWRESIEKRKNMSRPTGSRRVPKTPEQRQKIAEAIAAKWADPEYRQRVSSGMAKYYGKPVSVDGKKRRCSNRPSTALNSSWKKDDSKDDASMIGASTVPTYKDASAVSKLEMIKSIRAKRAATQVEAAKAVELARLLIAQAESAAKALEAASVKSPVAQASLTEARYIIAEAVQLIESIEAGQKSPAQNQKSSSEFASTLFSRFELEKDLDPQNNGDQIRVCARGSQLSSKEETFDFNNFTWKNVLNHGNTKLPAGSSFSSLHLGDFLRNSNTKATLDEREMGGHGLTRNKSPPSALTTDAWSEELERPRVRKKWIRGKFVEVTDSE